MTALRRAFVHGQPPPSYSLGPTAREARTFVRYGLRSRALAESIYKTRPRRGSA